MKTPKLLCVFTLFMFLITSCRESTDKSSTPGSGMDGVKETQQEAMEREKKWKSEERLGADTVNIDSTKTNGKLNE